MKRIGIKSLILIAMVIVLIAIAGYRHVFDIRRILALQPGVLWLAGFLASLLSFILCFFLRTRQESPYHLAFGPAERAVQPILLQHRGRALWLDAKGHAPAWELGRLSYLFLTIFGLLIAGFTILENRSLMLLDHFHHNMTKDYGQICPQEGEAPPEEEVKKPEKFGCELVKKAVALGYTKDLGDCADDPTSKDDEICEHRQWDEPGFHYSYRLIERFVGGMWTSTGGLSESLSPAAIAKRTRELPELGKHHAEGFGGEPRGSHHIFTDLKAPGSWSTKLSRAMHPNYCQDDLRELRFRLAEKGRDAGSQLEDAIAHLLFNPAVGTGSEYCRLYTIHWEAKLSTCQDLSSSGASTLAKLGIAEPIMKVLERERLEKAFPVPEPKKKPDEELAKDAEGKQGAPVLAEVKPAPPERPKVSFHCLMSKGPGPTQGSVLIQQQKFVVTGNTLPEPAADGLMPSQQLLQAVAQVFAPGFTYSNIDRKLPFTMSEEQFRQEIARSGDQLQLSKFELLRRSDILAGDQWVVSYPEYMEVYPWQPHLSNFVGRFRRALNRERDEP